MTEANSQSESNKGGNRKKAQMQEKRSEQLVQSQAARAQLSKALKSEQDNLRLCEELIDHSDGFYVEINKLAKGRTALPASPLVRQTANDIISDAKKLIKAQQDIHMDRIKEFVPAGDEPTYPDVLVVTGSLKHGLERHKRKQIARVKSAQTKLTILNTVIGALTYVLEDEEAAADEKEFPSEDAVNNYTEGPISGSCFVEYDDSDDRYFNFERLDSMKLMDYIGSLAGTLEDEKENNNTSPLSGFSLPDIDFGDTAKEDEEDEEE
jgi:hypothetical protein